MKLRNIAIAFLGSILFATCGKDDEGDKLYTPEESTTALKKPMMEALLTSSMMVFSKDLTGIIPMERRRGSIS